MSPDTITFLFLLAVAGASLAFAVAAYYLTRHLSRSRYFATASALAGLIDNPAIAPQHAPDAIPWLWEQIDSLKSKNDELKGDLVISDSRAQAALAHAEASNEAFVAIQHEQQRLIDALQDAITLLEGKPAKWAELAPDYGIDPKVFTPDALKQAVIAEYRTLILEVTTPTIDAPAPAAEATAEASAP